MKDATQHEWDRLSLESINQLIEGMPERIQSAKKHRGMATDFLIRRLFSLLARPSKTSIALFHHVVVKCEASAW